MLGLSDAQADAWAHLDLAAEVRGMTELPVSFARDTLAATVAELLQGRGRELPSFLYLFVDTFVGGGLVLNSHIHRGVHGNAGAVASLPLHTATPASAAGGVPQLLAQASVWTLEQRYLAHGLETAAAYDERALQMPWLAHTRHWLTECALALAHAIVAGTALLDMNAVVIDGSIVAPLLHELLEHTRQALQRYDWQGLFEPPPLLPGHIGADARALGVALLPLHASFAVNPDVFLKV
jgi:predicted NBD/HSP70 family sugar kinase